MNPEERQVLTLLVDAHNAFNALPRIHPSEHAEWVHSLHRLQDLIMIRPTMRAEGWDQPRPQRSDK